MLDTMCDVMKAAYDRGWITTKDGKYLDDFNKWWSYALANMLDYGYGSWFHELNPDQEVIDTTWPGKPDVYHAFNACLLTMYPFKPSFVGVVI